MLDGVTIVLIGFISQFINGSLGMGYGATSSSILIAVGLTPVVVSAAVHIGKVFAGLVSGVSHHAFGNVDRDLTLRLTVMGVIGGVIGALLLTRVSGDFIVPVVAAILLVLGARIFLRFSRRRGTPHPGPPWGTYPSWMPVPLGLIGGLVDAFGSAGWGPICMGSLAGRSEKEIRVLIGSVSMAEFFVSVAIVVTFALVLGADNFFWYVAGPLILGGVIAAPLAAYFTTRASPEALGSFVGLFLIVVNINTIAHFLPGALGMGAIIPPAFGLLASLGLVCVLGILRTSR